jgi:hypothetical protein
VLNELDSTAATYHWDDKNGTLVPTQVVTTLPTEFTGYSTEQKSRLRVMAGLSTARIVVTIPSPFIAWMRRTGR